MDSVQIVKSKKGCPDCHALGLQGLMWTCGPGHAGVGGNEHADRLISTTDITRGVLFRRLEIMKHLQNFLYDTTEHHSIDQLMEEKRSGSVFKETNIITVSRASENGRDTLIQPGRKLETEISENDIHHHHNPHVMIPILIIIIIIIIAIIIIIFIAFLPVEGEVEGSKQTAKAGRPSTPQHSRLLCRYH